jgi:hypothetical protein
VLLAIPLPPQSFPIRLAFAFRREYMKRTLLKTSLAVTLLAASFIASAQTSTPPSDQPAAKPAQKSYTDPTDPSKGHELVSDAKTPVVNPGTAGQDKAAGNNLVPEAKAGQLQSAGMNRPSFQALDVKKQGYLTADDVSTHAWLSKNFARCNTSHDGHLTSKQYVACRE